MTVKSSISLSDEQHAFAKTLVAAGRYPSVSAVLQEGVERLRREMEGEALAMAALKTLLEERRGGKFVSPAAMDKRLLRMLKTKRRAHGLPD